MENQFNEFQHRRLGGDHPCPQCGYTMVGGGDCPKCSGLLDEQLKRCKYIAIGGDCAIEVKNSEQFPKDSWCRRKEENPPKTDQYIKTLDRLYQKSPARVMSVISRNQAFRDNESTKRMYRDLYGLVTSKHQSRKSKWYNERYRILSTLVIDGIAKPEDYHRFCRDRRRKKFNSRKEGNCNEKSNINRKNTN